MAYYMEYSTRIYQVYMKYIASEDIIVYSIDEVFMDVTNYLAAYRLSPRDLARKIILDVLETTGITATAGIGTNLYLCKVAMDIVAKHIPADQYGVRIAELDEEEKAILDRKQRLLLEKLDERPTLTVTYFVPDEKKSGGRYVTKTGNLKKLHPLEKWMLLTDGTKIPLKNVKNIESPLFCHGV